MVASNISRKERLKELMIHAVETNGAFKLVPPKAVLEDVSLLRADDVIQKLNATFWSIEFRSGEIKTVGFTDLVLFLYNCRELRRVFAKLDPEEEATIPLVATSDPAVVMKPDVVRELFKDLEVMRGDWG